MTTLVIGGSSRALRSGQLFSVVGGFVMFGIGFILINTVIWRSFQR